MLKNQAIFIVFNLDLVSRGSNECWGGYNSTNATGWGLVYENNCIHSGAIKASGDLPTSWYNYTLASASTIIDIGTSSSNVATNDIKATESICPKGWTLPDNTQIISNNNISNFSPVLSGYYINGTLYDESTRGFWWGSEAYDGARRNLLLYDGGRLYSGVYYRRNGGYIRCVPAP